MRRSSRSMQSFNKKTMSDQLHVVIVPFNIDYVAQHVCVLLKRRWTVYMDLTKTIIVYL